MVPPVVLVFVDADIRQGQGDECSRRAADWLMFSYAVLYLGVFLYVASKLKNVWDGFKIKEELFFTAVIALFTVLLWLFFNNATEEFNDNTFAISTFCLLVGVAAVWSVSTIWPLYRAMKKSLELPAEILNPELLKEEFEPKPGETDADVLLRVLKNDKGRASFMQFLVSQLLCS